MVESGGVMGSARSELWALPSYLTQHCEGHIDGRAIDDVERGMVVRHQLVEESQNGRQDFPFWVKGEG